MMRHELIDSVLSECPGGEMFQTLETSPNVSSQVFYTVPGVVPLSSALALLLRRRGAMHGVGAVAQDQRRRVSKGLVCGVHAIASQQLSGHEDEGGVHILSLLSRGFQGGQHAVTLCQSAGVLEQDLPPGLQVRLIACRGNGE